MNLASLVVQISKTGTKTLWNWLGNLQLVTEVRQSKNTLFKCTIKPDVAGLMLQLFPETGPTEE